MPAKSREARRTGLRQGSFTRGGEIRRLMGKLEGDGFPRLQMFFLVTLTGAVGLAASFTLLHGGVESMPARYPLAVGCAYVAFLFLLWLWLRTKADDYLDGSFDIPLPDGSPDCASSGIEHAPEFSGGGGENGGGGASGSFQVDDSLPSPSLPDVDIPGGDSVGEAVGGVIGGADEGAVPLAIVLLIAALAAALLFASLYVVYLAPALFAELLVDGALSASLYRRMRGLQTRHWLESAVRRTLVPFAVTAISLGAIGYAFEWYAPQAHTFGEVLQQSRVPD
ncbi:MAG: hypothetical protein Q8M11_08060 [Sulfuritalea sp.]|nr:hypothetical protein [Sulfuritalea sp.]MDP1984443.1 hypothetical protein [Sulfuritalea sp.]